MNAEFQAICDRYVLDTANALHAASLLRPRHLLKRPAPGQPSVGEVLAHIAAAMEEHAAAAEGVIEGRPPPDLGHDHSSPGEGRPPGITPAELTRRLQGARHRVLTAIGTLPDVGVQATGVPSRLLTTLDGWSRHIVGHALDLAEAAPRLRADPVVLDWVLSADFRAEPALDDRQRRLLAGVQDELKAEQEAPV